MNLLFSLPFRTWKGEFFRRIINFFKFQLWGQVLDEAGGTSEELTREDVDAGESGGTTSMELTREYMDAVE